MDSEVSPAYFGDSNERFIKGAVRDKVKKKD